MTILIRLLIVLAAIAAEGIASDTHDVAVAQSAISLQPFMGGKSVEVTQTKNITGECGGAEVRIMGVRKEHGTVFETEVDAAKLIIRRARPQGAAAELDIGDIVLSDHNGLACVSTSSGFKLLIWSMCAGTACGEGFNFYIVDPQALVFLAPRNPSKEICNEKCASNVIGSKLPQQINKSLQ